MRRELCSLANCQQSLTPNLKEQEICLAQIDIACIRIALFQKHLYNPDQTTFVASIYKIDQAIREKQQEQLDLKLQQQHKTEREFLLCTMPKEQHDLVYAFSKTKSNKLAPYQTYDYKIKLTDKNSIRYSLLQQHTKKELLAIKTSFPAN